MYKKGKRRKHSQAGPQFIQIHFLLLNENSSLSVQIHKVVRCLKMIIYTPLSLSPIRRQNIQRHWYLIKRKF